MKSNKSNYTSQIVAGTVSLVIAIFVHWFIETKVESAIGQTNGLKELVLPISAAFGLITNIVIILNFGF